jgi:AraC-like DNA-binding protein
MSTSSERIEFSRPPELPGTEILLAEHSERRWRWFHETYTICTVMSGIGSADWIYRGKMHSGRPKEVLLYEPGEVHANQSILRDASFRVLFIDPSVIEKAALELDMRQPHWSRPLTSDPALFGAFARFHASLESPSTVLERESRLADCLRRTLKQCTETGFRDAHPGKAGLLRARDYIREHYPEHIALDILASVAGISRFHLVHAFSAEFGLPPHAYQIGVRITEARQLLVSGQPPSSVATATGFADQSHFGRHFKRFTGTTPHRYAKGGGLTSAF